MYTSTSPKRNRMEEVELLSKKHDVHFPYDLIAHICTLYNS